MDRALRNAANSSLTGFSLSPFEERAGVRGPFLVHGPYARFQDR